MGTTMKTKIIMISSIVGLDMSDVNHAVFVSETIRGIENLDAFIEFCRKEKGGISFATKTEKLDTLATRYKKMQESAKLPHALANGFTSKVVKKVEDARTYLKNELEVGNATPFRRLRIDGERYFTTKELNALAGVGTPSYIIELSEQNKLSDALYDLYMKNFAIKSKDELLSANQKKVHGLIEVKSA